MCEKPFGRNLFGFVAKVYYFYETSKIILNFFKKNIDGGGNV